MSGNSLNKHTFYKSVIKSGGLRLTAFSSVARIFRQNSEISFSVQRAMKKGGGGGLQVLSNYKSLRFVRPCALIVLYGFTSLSVWDLPSEKRRVIICIVRSKERRVVYAGE